MVESLAVSGADLKRFESKIDKTLWGCWLWTGPPDKDGYGRFWLAGKTRKAHRVAYETGACQKVPCPTCNKMLAKAGLKDHRRTQHKEIA